MDRPDLESIQMDLISATTSQRLFDETNERFSPPDYHRIDSKDEKKRETTLVTADHYEIAERHASKGTVPFGSVTTSSETEERISAKNGDVFQLKSGSSRTTGEVNFDYPTDYSQSYCFKSKDGFSISSSIHKTDYHHSPSGEVKEKSPDQEIKITYSNGSSIDIKVNESEELTLKIDAKSSIKIRTKDGISAVSLADGSSYEFDRNGMIAVTRVIDGKAKRVPLRDSSSST